MNQVENNSTTRTRTTEERPQFIFAVLTPDAKGAGRVEARIFEPARKADSRFKLVYGGWKDGSQFKYADELIHSANGYILHGQFPDYATADVLDHIFASGKPVVYFFDESLPELAGGSLLTKVGFRQYLIECLKHAHLVVVESEAHKNAYQTLCKAITVLPPRLAAEKYPVAAPLTDGVLRLLYRGNEGHLQNLLLVANALQQAADRHPGRIEFHLFGRGLSALGQHPSFHFHAIPATHYEWSQAISRIQPALALMPLADTPAANLASFMPLLEYSAYGIPVIASNSAPYQDHVFPGTTGLLADNRPESWLAAMESCLTNQRSCEEMSHGARQRLELNHTLSRESSGMAACLEQAINNAEIVRFSKPILDFQALHKQKPYQQYLASQRMQPRDIRWMEREISQWDKHLGIHLLITLLPGQTQWLPNTLDSLGVQVYPHWKLTIVAFTPVPDELTLDGRVHWYEIGDDEDSYEALNRLAKDEPADWVGFVEAGDMLPQLALFKLAFYARNKPVWRVMYTDEDQISPEFFRSLPRFKPDYNPDLLLSSPYIGNFCLFDRQLFSELGGINGDHDGNEVYELVLRSTERLAPEAIGHLAEILYSRFELGGHSIRAPQEILQSRLQAVGTHLTRLGIAAEVRPGALPATHEIHYPLARAPLVSIIIPTRDHLELIKPCVDSLLEKTDYPNFEVLILNNDSRDEDVLGYFKEIRRNPKIRIVDYPQPFNFSAICNLGAQEAKGEFLLLLNNDTEIIHPEWLDEMVRHGMRPEVGIVGARLIFPNRTVQHAGVIMGLAGIAGHPFTDFGVGLPGYMNRLQVVQNYSSVTGACLLISKDNFQSLGGMDETDLKILYNDVDLCLRARRSGLLVVWTPLANLVHKASISLEKIQEGPTLADQRARSYGEHHTMCRRWLDWMAFDPAYNRNLTLESNNYGIEPDACLSWDPLWRPAPRVVAYPGDTEGCGEYRIFGPCRALNNAGLAQAFVSEKLYYPAQLAKVNPDVIVLQRQVEDNHLDAIGEIRRYSKAFRVFEIDDLLHDLPPKSIHRGAMHGDELERLAEAISQCDRLVTTSPVLAEAYGGYCGEVKIVPNFLERAKWGMLKPQRQQGRLPRVGWAGGISHTGDLLQLHNVIKTLHKEVDWIFLGTCPELLRPYIKEFHNPVKLDFYPSKLASLNLDLALAPLEYNHFNEAKSALKVLEYGILGYPVICTDIITYQGDFPVMRVSNKPSEWIEAIRYMIGDRDNLATQGDLLREHIHNQWMLEDNLNKWLEGWLP
jgi:GT2 family glycosyltransferase/glycosyltransferase involved in cell wall biosynthesis